MHPPLFQYRLEEQTNRRYATLVAVVSEANATLVDEIIDIRDRIIGHLFNQHKNR